MKKLSLFTICIMISTLMLSQIIHVPADQPTIQAGINAADKGDTVLVAEGTYYENVNFRGKAITLASNYILDADTNYINNTIIDGSSPTYSDSAAVITLCNAEDSASIICGFTITGGAGNKISAPPIGELVFGGGICCDHAGAKIIHNKIIDNHVVNVNATAGGGIGLNEQGDIWAVIKFNRIENNSSEGSILMAFGGGIALNGKSIVLGNTIKNNSILCQDGYAQGGGLYAEAAIFEPDSVIIDQNIFISNVAECNGEQALGGGLMMYYCKPIITNNIFSDNTSKGGNGVVCFGGAVSLCKPMGDVAFSENLVSENLLQSNGNLVGPGFHLWEASSGVYITNNVFYRNIASKDNYSYGGGINISDVKENPVLIEGNRVIENQARSAGGLLIRWCYNVQVVNNLFSGNSSFRGGGITMTQDQPTSNFKFEIINNTFFNNTADDWGGAIRMYNDEGGNVVSFNNIFWGNTALNAGNTISNTSADTILVYYSDIDPVDIDGKWSGSENIIADPLFNPDDSLCHIHGGPCHNTGIGELEIGGTMYFAPIVDYEGTPRPQGITWDIGADECLMEFIYESNTKSPFNLLVNPNPSSGAAHIRYSILETRDLRLELFTSNGILVRTLFTGKQLAGEHELNVDLSELPNGLYFISLQADGQSETSKIIILK